MGIANSILGTANKLISAINPIELFQQYTWTKLGNAYHQQMAAAADPLKVMKDIVKGSYNLGRTNFRSAVDNYRGADPGIARGMADYMKGYKIGLNKADIAPGRLRFNSIARKTAMAGLGAYSASSFLFGNNPLTETVDQGTKLGFHATVGSLAYTMNRKAGIAYAGLGMFNILRSGDNLGPY